MERQQILCRRWWESSPLSPSPRHCLTLASHFFRQPRARSWHDPWPSGPSSMGPTNVYPSTPASSSSSYSTSSDSRVSSSNSATPIPIGGYCSNMGAIAGGVAGGIAAIALSLPRCPSICDDIHRLRPLRPQATGSPWIHPTYGSSSSANVGSGNRRVDFPQYDHLSAEALRMCFRGPGSAYVCSRVFSLS
jgi:hypothetical protein